MIVGSTKFSFVFSVKTSLSLHNKWAYGSINQKGRIFMFVYIYFILNGEKRVYWKNGWTVQMRWYLAPFYWYIYWSKNGQFFFSIYIQKIKHTNVMKQLFIIYLKVDLFYSFNFLNCIQCCLLHFSSRIFFSICCSTQFFFCAK